MMTQNLAMPLLARHRSETHAAPATDALLMLYREYGVEVDVPDAIPQSFDVLAFLVDVAQTRNAEVRS